MLLFLGSFGGVVHKGLYCRVVAISINLLKKKNQISLILDFKKDSKNPNYGSFRCSYIFLSSVNNLIRGRRQWRIL